MSVQPPADEPPDDRAAGWHPHAEHPTVQRYWDGAAWTGEHRFAPMAPDDDLLPARPDADVVVTLTTAAQYAGAALRGASGGVWLGAAFGLPWIHLGACFLLAETVDDCSASPQGGWAAGLGIVTWLGSLASAERGLRLLDVRIWLRVVVVAVVGLYSAYIAYIGVLLVALAAFCFSC